MSIGEVIKDRRQKRNLTQAQLADMLNITPQAVSRWEMGVSYPDIAMLPKISEALRVTADELLGMPGKSRESEGTAKEGLNQSQVDSIFDYVPRLVTRKSKKVLIADDADFLRGMVRDILSREGHDVLQAKDGAECLDVLEKESVDVCVLDIMMPGVDGFEVLGTIKRERPDVKVIMLSALNQESAVRQAMRLGADAYLVKPFAAEWLIERVG